MLSSRPILQHNAVSHASNARCLGVYAAKSIGRSFGRRNGVAGVRHSAIPRLSTEGRLTCVQSRGYADYSLRYHDSTIFALSTAPGRAAIAVIRISGPACKQIYASLCTHKPLPKPRYAALRTIVHPREPQRVLDSGALVLSFPAPKTVTGEDLLELHVHGGPAIVTSILAAISEVSTREYPVRYAEPGEFTRRAFYNDRLDLTQVEALGDTLSAVTEEQRRLSVQGTRSQLGSQYEQWRNMLLYARGELEALIDFSEDQHFDESAVDLASNVAAQVRALLQALEIHSQNATRGELLRSGIAVSLIGTPNVGKSSILNQIVGRNAAIVSKEAGTTRDIVEVGIDLGGFFCRLGDTAGLRKAKQDQETSSGLSPEVGEIEQEGIRRARALAEQSDVVIVVFSISSNAGTSRHSVDLDPEVVATANALAALGKRLIIAINKSDLLHTREAEDSPHASSGAGTSAEVTRDNQLVAAVRVAIPSVQSSSVFLISCTAAQTTKPETQAQGTSTSPSALTKSSESDPGHFRAFVNGIITVFRDMTTALHPRDEDQQVSASRNSQHSSRGAQFAQDDASMWEDSLGATARQRQLLDTCREELVRFLDLIPGARPSPATRNGSLNGEAVKATSSSASDLSDQARPRADAQSASTLSEPPPDPPVGRDHTCADLPRDNNDTTVMRDATMTASEGEGQATIALFAAGKNDDQPSGAEDSTRTAFAARGLRPSAPSDGPLRQPHEGITSTAYASHGSALHGTEKASLEDPNPHTADLVSQRDHAPLANQAYDAGAERGADDEVDIVAAAEHLRAAAAALGQITGRGDVGDVEEVLGVVFEKFCVGK